jgi:hypothetical protein
VRFVASARGKNLGDVEGGVHVTWRWLARSDEPTARVTRAAGRARIAGLAIAGALSVAGAVAMSGCGASNAIDPVAQAARATARVSGARTSITGGIVAAGRRIPMTGTGFMDPRGQRGAFTFHMAVAGRTIAMRELLVKHTLYMASSLFRGKLGHGKTWVKIDIARAAKAQGIDIGALQPTTGSPQDQVQYLLASTHATKVGTEPVRGVPTTHYHTVVDLDRLAQKVPPARRAAAQASVRNLEKLTHTSKIPMDVWIDAHHLVRRQHLSYTMTTNGQTARLDFTFELYDFGTRFAASAPPASQVYDATGLAAKTSG